jgi:hypothetical protein
MLALRGDVLFCHATAAALWKLPLPLGIDELHVSSRSGLHPPRRTGVIGHKLDVPASQTTTLGAVPVTTASRTMLDLANDLKMSELVAVGDAALRSGHLNREELRALARWAKGRRGVTNLKKAIPFLDDRAESAPESFLRVWLSTGGLPSFAPNVSIFRGDEFIARVDLYCEHFKVAVEYEGAHHRSREQYARDIRRRARLLSMGIEVIQVDATMLGSPRAIVLVVADVLSRRGWAGRPTTSSMLR